MPTEYWAPEIADLAKPKERTERRVDRPVDGRQSLEVEPVPNGPRLGQVYFFHVAHRRCPQTPPGIRGLSTPSTARE